MNILTEYDTIKYLLKHKCSIARYGDGELKLCLGRSAKSQTADKYMGKMLRNILKSDNPKCLVGIPRVFSRKVWSSPEKKQFWYKWSNPKVMGLYNPKKLYGSAFITRPDAAPEIYNQDYFKLVKKLWEGKKIILVQGEYQRFNKSKTLLGNSSLLYTVCEPRRDAFTVLDEIISFISTNYEDNMVVVLSLGPTATVLAYELSLLGVQALDLGHMGQFYSKVHPKGVDYSGEAYETNQ